MSRILVVDDDIDLAHILRATLEKNGFVAAEAHDGKDALVRLEREAFDALLVDWMLPFMDGIELIRWIRGHVSSAPVVIMMTAITLPKARAHAFQAGADDFISKPFDPQQALKLIRDGLARRAQPAPLPAKVRPEPPAAPPDFIAVSIATSAGGPLALKAVLRSLPERVCSDICVFVVLHAPDWMIGSLPDYLRDATPLKIQVAEHNLRADPGHLFIAPAGRHLTLERGTFRIKLTDSEMENFVRPSADPLFRSTASVFGRFSVGVILTGMGRDGTQGASHIAAAGGVVLAQDPDTATAPSMPQTAIQAGVASQSPLLEEIGPVIAQEVERLSLELKKLQPR